MKTETKVLPQGITQEMIDAAKIKWPKEGEVKLAVLPRDEYGTAFLEVLLRRPCRTVMSEFTKFADKNPKRADDILIKSCLLSHKEEVLADDDLATAAVDAIAQMITVRKAELKNI